MTSWRVVCPVLGCSWFLVMDLRDPELQPAIDAHARTHEWARNGLELFGEQGCCGTCEAISRATAKDGTP